MRRRESEHEAVGRIAVLADELEKRGEVGRKSMAIGIASSASQAARLKPRRRLHAEQFRGIAPEDRQLVLVGDRRAHHVLDRMCLPRDRVVGAEHQLARADLADEVAQAFAGEHHRVEIKLVHVFRRLLLQLDLRTAVLRRHEARMVAAHLVGRQVSAAVRGQHLEPGEFVERALEDQVLQRDRGVERIADGFDSRRCP